MKVALAITLPVVALLLAITILCLCFLRRRLAREDAPSCKLPSQFGTMNVELAACKRWDEPQNL